MRLKEKDKEINTSKLVSSNIKAINIGVMLCFKFKGLRSVPPFPVDKGR